MQINLTGDTEKSIERRLAAGQFDSPEEVIQAAVEQLDRYEESVADLRESLEDEQAGRVQSIRHLAQQDVKPGDL